MEMEYIYIDFSKEELENFRDEDGFINLDLIGIDFNNPKAREKMGSQKMINIGES